MTTLFRYLPVPPNATLLNNIYEDLGKEKKTCGALDYIVNKFAIPRLTGLCTIPIAAITAIGYGLRGTLKASYKLIDLEFGRAGRTFSKNIKHAFQCTILTVANIFYALFGLFGGQFAYKKSVQIAPEMYEPLPIDFAAHELDQVKQELEISQHDSALERIQQLKGGQIDSNFQILKLNHENASLGDQLKAKEKQLQAITEERDALDKIFTQIGTLLDIKSIDLNQQEISQALEKLIQTNQNLTVEYKGFQISLGKLLNLDANSSTPDLIAYEIQELLNRLKSFPEIQQQLITVKSQLECLVANGEAGNTEKDQRLEEYQRTISHLNEALATTNSANQQLKEEIEILNQRFAQISEEMPSELSVVPTNNESCSSSNFDVIP